MDLREPPRTDNEELNIWLNELYDWLKYPGKFEVQYIEMKELSADVAAPGTNRVRIYAIDDTAKTELRARFATGVVQQIAEEP